jgi:hypothetical protein
MANLTLSSFLCVYFNPLHVSSNLVLITRRINCINTTSDICHSVSVTFSCAGRKVQQNIKKELFPWRQTAHRELSPINYNYVTNNTVSSSPTTILLLGTSYYNTRIVHNNTAVQNIHQTILLVGLKYKESYCVNTHTMALGSTQPVTELSTRNIPQG